MLVTADETGITAGVDLRMIGGQGDQKAVLWQSRNATGGITCMAVASRPSDGRLLVCTKLVVSVYPLEVISLYEDAVSKTKACVQHAWQWAAESFCCNGQCLKSLS